MIEGALDILALGKDQTIGVTRYAISFAAYNRGGGALPAVSRHGLENLHKFLIEIGMPSDEVASIVKEVDQTHRVSIPRIQLTEAQLKHYGLGEMSIGASILSYLSA